MVTLCGVVAPSTHCAGTTVGATGVTSSHVAPARVTVNRAVTGVTWIHPAGIWPQAKPSANVAVTVTGVFTVPTYGPGGLTT